MWPWKKENKVIEIGWLGLADMYPLATLFPPEPFKYDSDIPGCDFLRCPAIQEGIKNIYTIRSPIDFSLRQESGGLVAISTMPTGYPDAISDNYISDGRLKGVPIAQVPLDQAFISDTPDVMLEVIPSPLGRYHGHSFVPGKMDIYSWPARNISAAYEWYNTHIPVSYKRGDVLFCIRLTHPSNRKIVIRTCQLTSKVRKVTHDISVIKNGFRYGTKPMIKNYKNLRPKKLIEWL